MNAVSAPTPWYREPLAWMVFAIPLLTVPAGIATWIIAAQVPADSVTAPVTRVGQVQTIDLEPDLEAARLGLSAVLTIDRQRGAIHVRLPGAPSGAPPLLHLDHPIDAARDRVVTLETAGSDSFRAALGESDGQRLICTLEAADGRWRLGGRLEPGATVATLTPALPAR